MQPATRLDTQRLMLRPLGLRDAPFYALLIGNPEVRRFLGGPVLWSHRLRRFRADFGQTPGKGLWLVEAQGPRAPIGIIELGPHKDGGDVELSYQFSPAYWGHGFAREAARCVLAHAREDLLLPRVIAETQGANLASCRLLFSLGMREVQRLQRFGAEQVIFATPDAAWL